MIQDLSFDKLSTTGISLDIYLLKQVVVVVLVVLAVTVAAADTRDQL